MSTHRTHRRRAAARGTSLVEAMAAIAVLLIGLTGYLSLQLVSSRANTFSRRMAQATAIATDLAENMALWSYNDTRLSPSGIKSVASLEDPLVKPGWDLGRAAAPSPTPQFSDKAGNLGAYPGLTGDADGDGTAEFTRYWSVYAADFNNTGTANGKLVQIVVRWEEPGVGFRQVTTVAYKANPAVVLQ